MNLVTVVEGSLAWGDRPLLDQAALAICEGERIGLIGRNGAGKSSLLKVLAQKEKLDSGELQLCNGLNVAYVEQEPQFAEAPTWMDALIARGHLEKLADEKHRWRIQSRISEYLHRFGLDEAASPNAASGGERKKAALSLALALEPNLLLLDEPTNHLDIDAITRLEETLLSEFKKSRSLLVITHDRSFLNTVVDKIFELDRGVIRSYPGTFEEYETRKQAELEAEDKARSEFDKVLAQEEVWIRKGIEARRTRNEGRVRRLEKMRVEREMRRDRLGCANLSIDEGEKSGKIVAELQGVSKSFGGRALIKNLDLIVKRGDKIGLLGPNGVGKSTLIKIILGQMAPDEGTVKLGTNLQIAYFDQLRSELDPDKTLQETVSPGSDWVEIAGVKKHVIGYLGDFLFPAHRVNVKVSSLSGGERNRLLLAKLFARPANLLVMDEPTNDLDIESMEMLEDRLSSYGGTVLLVSHDRAFMDNVATLAIAPNERGEWRAYAGGYEEWLRFREEDRKAAAQAAKAKLSSEGALPAAEKPSKAQRRPAKLSFKETKQLEALPEEIGALESLQSELVSEMQSADYARKSPEQMREHGEKLQKLQADLEEKYALWEELEAKKAAIDSAQ